MATELRWIVSTLASTLHASAALIAGATPIDLKTAQALDTEVESLRSLLGALGIDAPSLFEHLVPTCVQFDDLAKMAEITLVKILGPGDLDQQTRRLGDWLARSQSAFFEANPRALEELELRAAPIREQWEARGPGLLTELARLTTRDLIVGEADVILVQPILGGGGTAHRLYNSVRIEAVLANPVSELPEVLRLGWLLAQLNLDLPKFAEHLSRERGNLAGMLAMIPPTLAAAEAVELTRFGTDTLARAISAWTPSSLEADKLSDWWETYQASKPDWSVALGALDRMLISFP